jgi:uncharacterized protein YggU (UPF0235/DUF167 family)
MKETNLKYCMYIKVTVTPNAKKEKLTRISEDSFEVSVKKKAQKNMANRRVCELMANHFKVLSKKARIITGHRSPKKIIDIAL